ncbi:MAG: PEP-CTERM sorting domain-containing protein [Hydrococcus sp. RM1_1_31]|nr:PEP-CTERM sorting domain-containing protein [Hydrococcus sp. RM1_1_31]
MELIIFLQVASPKSFENREDEAIALPDREFLTFLNDFARRNGSFSFPEDELSEDFGQAFVDGNNPFLDFFDSFENGDFNPNNPDLNDDKEIASVPEPSFLLGFLFLGVGLLFSKKKVYFVSRRGGRDAGKGSGISAVRRAEAQRREIKA